MNMACGVSVGTWVNLMHIKEFGPFIPTFVDFDNKEYKLISFTPNDNALYEQVDE